MGGTPHAVTLPLRGTVARPPSHQRRALVPRMKRSFPLALAPVPSSAATATRARNPGSSTESRRPRPLGIATAVVTHTADRPYTGEGMGAAADGQAGLVFVAGRCRCLGERAARQWASPCGYGVFVHIPWRCAMRSALATDPYISWAIDRAKQWDPRLRAKVARCRPMKLGQCLPHHICFSTVRACPRARASSRPDCARVGGGSAAAPCADTAAVCAHLTSTCTAPLSFRFCRCLPQPLLRVSSPPTSPLLARPDLAVAPHPTVWVSGGRGTAAAALYFGASPTLLFARTRPAGSQPRPP